MLLPEDLSDPPLTDEDLDAYFAWQPEFGDEGLENLPSDDGVARVADWSVCDTGSAEWAMRKLGHAEALIAARDADAREFHAQIDRWLAGETKRSKQAVNFFAAQLEAYARRRREEQDEKTLTLPSGKVTSRLNPARPKVVDEEVFVEWAKANNIALVKAKWSPVMAAVKKLVEWAPTEDGPVPVFGDVVVPGLVQVPAEVTYTVEPSLP